MGKIINLLIQLVLVGVSMIFLTIALVALAVQAIIIVGAIAILVVIGWAIWILFI